MSCMLCIVKKKSANLANKMHGIVPLVFILYQTEYSYMFQSTRDHHQRITPNNTI